MVAAVIKAGQTPIVPGGGHDLAYGHYRGVRAATAGKQTAIINFDALNLPLHPRPRPRHLPQATRR